MTSVSSSEVDNVDAAQIRSSVGIVRNLNGQRLGRKGRLTRQRIISSADRIVRESKDLQISLSAVAREADMRMTSLYNYFSDLTEVLLAVLDEVMAEAETAYLSQLRRRWDDENLDEECGKFLNSFYEFWQKHANLLHLRNNIADQRNQQMIATRVTSAREIIALLVFQMDGEPKGETNFVHSMASVLYMGIERAISVLNNPDLPKNLPGPFRPHVQNILAAETKLLAFAIRDQRA